MPHLVRGHERPRALQSQALVHDDAEAVYVAFLAHVTLLERLGGLVQQGLRQKADWWLLLPAAETAYARLRIQMCNAAPYHVKHGPGRSCLHVRVERVLELAQSKVGNLCAAIFH